MPIMSTPASPTPYVDAGEELMLVLRDFLSASLSFNQKNANPNDHLYLQSIERNTDSALKLLKEMPVAKEAVFEYFSFVIDLLVTQEFSEKTPARSLISSLEKLYKSLLDLIKHPKLGLAWSPILVHWLLDVLGDLSSKGNRSKNQLNEDLSCWLSTLSGSKLVDLAAECMTRLNENQTESCINHLLDLSVRHGSKFDWVVAHIGSCFPNIVITRVLSVGLKSQSESAKINSVVRILNHLGGTHKSDIKDCILSLVTNHQDPLVIPFLLNLASMSELIAASVINVASELISDETAEKVAGYIPTWYAKDLIKDDTFSKLVVDILLKYGKFKLIQYLIEFSSEDCHLSRDVINGSRYIMDLLLVDLHNLVHSASRNEENKLVKDCSMHWPRLMEQYLFNGDAYQRKIVTMLLNVLFLHEGRTLTAMALQKGLCTAVSDDELSSVLLLIKDVEMWMPEVVTLAIKLCFRSKSTHPQFLPNLGKILHYQNEANSGDMIETDVYQIVKCHHEDLIHIASDPTMIKDVIKILNFVPLPDDQPISVSLQLKACNHLSKALFIYLSQENEELLAQIIEHLQALANSVIGVPMVLRGLLSGALNVPIFGGGLAPNETKPTPMKSTSTRLYEENLKFGAMPTHPLGTSTVFHAGVIGEGKRQMQPRPIETEQTKKNSLVFITILFKICEEVTVVAKEETYKQLALLLVELVSPDVMYNGLPWPEEDFTRVTMERDLQIVKRLEDNPIIWKVLWGIAEARPALCYCSVILRGALAVQMAHWSSALTSSPKLIATTKKILELMSVGQYLPPPLDSVSEVLHHFHPYQVHCVLVDVWNYVRDNVPSPVAFVTNGKGCATRKFGHYNNHKQYCERLRLIMIQHISKVSAKYREFFVANADPSESKMNDNAMDTE